jgi:hypothetical protein
MDPEPSRSALLRRYHIVDLYQSREHLGSLAAKLYPQDEPARKRWIMVEQAKLDEGKIEDLVAALRSRCLPPPPDEEHKSFG